MGTDRARETLRIVGAGPVGSLLALFLARRGFDVELYERRPDMRREALSAGRSINLAVSTRGLHALRSVGMEREVLATATPMQGRMMHAVSGELSFQPYGKADSDCIYSISRGGLNQALMTAAEATGRVRIHFRHPALGLDAAGALRVKDDVNGQERTLAPGSVVFGTDGSASALRADVIGRTRGERSQQLLDYGYKELQLPAGAGGQFQLERKALHIWPRGTFMLIALPNFDRSFTCTLFLPFEGDAGSPSFATLQTPEQVERFFGEWFPDARKLLPGLEQEFFGNPTGQMVTVKCSPWNLGGNCLLLGDAAHAIVPFFGQGMNCGFEDCAILDELLAAELERGAVVDWSRLFATFSQERKPNADAIADMAAENFVEMRDKVGDARFLLEKQVERILMNRFPEDYFSRYALVTFSRVPYRMALEAGLVQQGILSELCRGLSSADQVDLQRAEVLIRERLKPGHKAT
jgi:kynurenine 3-monooxygenase